MPGETPRKNEDKRQTARDVNKPVPARQPHTGVNKAKDKRHVDRDRGRGTDKTSGT